MNKAVKILVVVALVAVVAVVILARRGEPAAPSQASSSAAGPVSRLVDGEQPAQPQGSRPAVGPLPRLVDLGSTMCIPCKMMTPVLEELKKEYAGRLQVEFVDVTKDPDAARKYGVKVIPTQVFFDATGRERFRHEGFFSKEDILAKWKALGMDLSSPASASASTNKGGGA